MTSNIKKNTREKKFWEQLGDRDVTNWKIESIYPNPGGARCCCNQPIKEVYLVRHKDTRVEKIVGKCCARRLGLYMKWRTKADYLANAMLLAKQDWEKDMIKQLQNKLPKWGSRLKISYKQMMQLERITKHNWRGTLW